MHTRHRPATIARAGGRPHHPSRSSAPGHRRTAGEPSPARGRRAPSLPWGLATVLGFVLSATALARTGGAQVRPTHAPPSESTSAPLAASPQSSLDSLLRHAYDANPRLRAARDRVAAARARIAPAGARPDPMLMAGVQNFPVSEPGFADFMTMKMVGVGQTVPYPGKLALRRRAAEHEADAARAALAAAVRQAVREVRGAYYELAYLDQALGIVERNQRVLADVIRVAEARYGVGQAGQQDVLRARIEATRLAEQAVALTEQRRSALARLNAALDRPSEAPVASPHVPGRVARAAVADSAHRVRFASATLGARAADSPLPPLVELQEAAMRESPELREHETMIAAQGARVALARREHLPDFDVSLQYGQRQGLSDMVTATVSVPLPLQRRRKQDHFVVEARAELAALEAEHDARRNELRAEVARLHSELERQRAQLALYVKAIIPQGRASLASATAGYQSGRAEFLGLLESQATLFGYETEYFRTLSDFATTLAELERVLGKEIL